MGLTSALEGTADIGMASRYLKEDEKSDFPDDKQVYIVQDGLAIIVNKDNPVENLTLEQVRDIYTHKIHNWKEVGGPDEAINVFTREAGSGTRGAFEDLVMDDENPINATSNVQSSNGSLASSVAGDTFAIGYVSLGSVDSGVKAVKLDGIDATAENVLNKTYKLYRPFLFVLGDEVSEAAQHFIDFVLSAKGQELLADEGLISSRF